MAFRLLDLPRELRDTIYELLFDDNNCIDPVEITKAYSRLPSFAVTATSHSVRYESLPYLRAAIDRFWKQHAFFLDVTSDDPPPSYPKLAKLHTPGINNFELRFTDDEGLGPCRFQALGNGEVNMELFRTRDWCNATGGGDMVLQRLLKHPRDLCYDLAEENGASICCGKDGESLDVFNILRAVLLSFRVYAPGRDELLAIAGEQEKGLL